MVHSMGVAGRFHGPFGLLLQCNVRSAGGLCNARDRTGLMRESHMHQSSGDAEHVSEHVSEHLRSSAWQLVPEPVLPAGGEKDQSFMP